MPDKYHSVGVITEVQMGEEADEFAGTKGSPNRLVMNTPKFKYPLSVGWFGNPELVDAVQELVMSGEAVKVTYIAQDPVERDGKQVRYKNLIDVVNRKGDVLVEVPGALEDFEFGNANAQSGGNGKVTVTNVGGQLDPVSLRLFACQVAASILAPQGAFTGKPGNDLSLLEAGAREILAIVGADPDVAEGFQGENPAF